jgi:8-amino-7-oxononanoate synthase
MDLIADLVSQLRALDVRSLTRQRRVVETPCGPRVRVDGRDLLAFASNDYLGLAAHPAVVEALAEGARRHGAGSGASHLISGHSRAHAQLEERLAGMLADNLEQPRALYFSTGYMANLAVLTALGAGGEAEIFSEALNHASLIDGARLARAQVCVIAHADVDALARALDASSACTKIVVTDSVFSMDGTLAPLAALLALCEQHGAWLVVDDAHGFGTLGARGHGALEHCGLRSPNLVYVGTLGKAAGVSGAFIAAHASAIEFMVQRARPYIYTTAAPPALAHALLASLDIIEGEEGAARRAHLNRLIALLDDTLTLTRWQRPLSHTAIQPIVIGGNDEALYVAGRLHEQGLWVPAIRPPTVAPGTSRLRVTLCAAHTEDEVARLAATLNAFEHQLERSAA